MVITVSGRFSQDLRCHYYRNEIWRKSQDLL